MFTDERLKAEENGKHSLRMYSESTSENLSYAYSLQNRLWCCYMYIAPLCPLPLASFNNMHPPCSTTPYLKRGTRTSLSIRFLFESEEWSFYLHDNRTRMLSLQITAHPHDESFFAASVKYVIYSGYLMKTSTKYWL